MVCRVAGDLPVVSDLLPVADGAVKCLSFIFVNLRILAQPYFVKCKESILPTREQTGVSCRARGQSESQKGRL